VDRSILANALERIERELDGQPVVQAHLYQAIAGTYVRLGLFAAAAGPQGLALSLRRRELGDDHPDTLASIRATGLMYRWQYNLPESERFLEAALAGQRRVLGPRHLATLNTLTELASLRGQQWRCSEGESLAREAFEGRRSVLGEDHPATLSSANGLAEALCYQNPPRLGEAEPLLVQTLQKRRKVLGDDHPHTVGTLRSLGQCMLLQGRMAEAEAYHRQALDGRRRVLGDAHPYTLWSLREVGNLLLRLDRIDEAAAFCEEAAALSRHFLDPTDIDFVLSHHLLVRLRRAQGRLREAETMARDLLHPSRVLAGEDGDVHLGTTCVLATVLIALDTPESVSESEMLLRKVLQTSDRTIPAEHVMAHAAIRSVLGGALTARARHLAASDPRTALALISEAEALLLHACELAPGEILFFWVTSRPELRRRVIELYEVWDSLAPGSGHDHTADDLHRRLHTQP
jgi:eukaryotic-like serine/threonine-protein kinase